MTGLCCDCGALTGTPRHVRCGRCHAAHRRLVEAERAFAHGFAAGLAAAGRDPDAPAAREALAARLAELREEVARA